MGPVTKERHQSIEAELSKLAKTIKATNLMYMGKTDHEIAERTGLSVSKLRWIRSERNKLSVVKRARRIILNRAIGNRSDEQMMDELLKLPRVRCPRRQLPTEKTPRNHLDVYGRSFDDDLITWEEYLLLTAKRRTRRLVIVSA